MYDLVIKSKPRRAFKKLPKADKKRLIQQLETLSKKPFKISNVKAIKDYKNGYRLRVGRWRILYCLDTKSKVIEVIDIFMRKDKNYSRIFRMLFSLLG